MAVVMLALNGEGLGHLIRSTLVGQALASVGERPVIFSQGKYEFSGTAQFPGRRIPSLWKAPEQVRKQVASALSSMAGISLPAVVVEDTHPNPIHLPEEIRRVLLVRPTSFEYLVHLNAKYGSLYSAFLLCDSPDSPTWPYDDEQTRQLANWKSWHIVGPIYRTPTSGDIQEVRARYGFADGQEVCVFTMGGGGTQNPDDRDVADFLRLASEVADIVQPAGSDARLIFVRGPYFPADAVIPSRFEVVADEAQMPALLKLARGAVIRAGFNTTWECLAAGTPFIPLVGTTFEEPVRKRVEVLDALGLLPKGAEQFWFDDEWRSAFRRIAHDIVSNHGGSPDPFALQRLILDRPSETVPTAPPAPHIRRAPAKHPIPFTVRIDDAVCKEPAFCWLLELLASRGLCGSVEVIPYLLEFDEQFLDRFDPSRTLFQVSQHGYAHVPNASESGRRCEFSPENRSPSADELARIARGKQQLQKAFPTRFTGGFSAPYDALPPWLPDEWKSLGGTFVSRVLTKAAPNAALPITGAGVAVWDWTRDRALSPSQLGRKLSAQLASDGHIGIVLQPRCFRESKNRATLIESLDYIERFEVMPATLRDCALGKVDIPDRPARGWGGRLRNWFAGDGG